MVEAEFSEKDGLLEGYGKIFRGNKKNGVYETWYNEDYHSLESREHYKGGKANGTVEGWHKDGSKKYKGTFKDDRSIGKFTSWNTDGSIFNEKEYNDEGDVIISRTYYDGGLKASEYGIGLPSLKWDKQGRLVSLSYYYKNSIAKESYSLYVELDPKRGRITWLDYEEDFELKFSYRERGLFFGRKREEALNALKKSNQELYDMVRKYQPGCLVNTRIGNGLGDYVSCGDNTLPKEYTDKLMESPVTLNRTWGYKSFDNDCKNPEEVLEILKKCNTFGANLLLNVGPDHLGRIPAPAVEILREVGKRRREM
jgi:hypothetical protein